MPNTYALDQMIKRLSDSGNTSKGGNDAQAITNALSGVTSAVRSNYFSTPYVDSAPSYTTPPPQAQAPAAQKPVNPTITYAPQTQTPAQPTSATGNWFGDLVKGVTDNIAGNQQMLGNIPIPITNTQTANLPEPIANVGGAILGLGQSVLEGAGQIPVVGDWLGQAGNAVNQGLEWYNENINTPAAGLGSALTEPLDRIGTVLSGVQDTGYGLNQALQGNPQPLNQAFADIGSAFTDPLTNPFQDSVNTDTFQPTLAAFQQGNYAKAASTLVQTLKTIGDVEYDALPPEEQLAASFVLDPLNFIPGLGIEKLQKAGKLAEITTDVARIENAADLLPKGILGKISTPAAKVTEVVKSGLQNVLLRTSFTDNADDMFNTWRAFEKAGQDAKGFDEIVKTYAGLASVPAQRASKLLQGFSKNIDEVEQAYRTLQNGVEVAGDTSKLPKTFARFAEDVKKGTAKAEDLLEVTQAEMAARAQAHMAAEGGKLFPLSARSAPVNVARRLLNELKGLEALAYIGLSPVTFAKNIVNGITTMAIEGVNPLFNASGEIARLRRLGQVEKATNLQRAVNLQKTMTRTGGVVREALGEGKFSTAQTGAFGSFMSKMIQGTPLGAPLRWYEATEQAMRAKVWTNTYYKAVSHNWDSGKWIPKLDAATEAVLHQYRVAPEEIYNIVREAGSDGKKVMRELNAYMDGSRGAAVDWENVAREMGMDKQSLLNLMDEHDEAKAASMAQEIAARVAGGEDKAVVVDEVVANAAQETAQATAERIGLDLGDDAATLEARRGDLVRQWNQANNGKGMQARKNADALMGEIEAVERRLDELKGAANVTETIQPTETIAGVGSADLQRNTSVQEVATPLDANPLPPADLPTEQLTQGQQNARSYLLERKRSDGTPIYTAEQLATWRPDSIERIAGEMQMARATFDDVMRTARDAGVPTATAKGRPNDRQLLNVLNKHKAEGTEKFASIYDVRTRADEAKGILDSYTPQGKGAKNGTGKSARLGEPVLVPDVGNDASDLASVDTATADMGINIGNDFVPVDTGNSAAEAINNLRKLAEEDADAARILSRDEMVKAKARTQADLYEALLKLWSREDVRKVRLGSDAKNRVMAWARREVMNAAGESRMAATVAADWMDNAVMISRDGETVFDAALSVVAPFQFWRSRYAIQSLRRVADKPARLAWYLKLRDLQDQVQNDPRYPKRLRGRMFLPIPGIPQWAGGGMWFDPLEQLTSIKAVFGQNQFEDGVTDQDVAASIRALAQRGQISLSEASNAIANGKGALWDATKMQLENLTKESAGGDAFTDLFRPHLPLDIIWKLKTGNAADLGVLFPMTRLIRGATSMLPKGGALNPTGQGINIEQPLKAGLRALTGNQDIPDWDMWEQYRTDRALADMVGDGLITERDAMLALIERRGTYYEAAQQRAQEQMRLQNYSVFGGQIFPEGEKAYYKASVLRNRIIDQTVAQLGGNPAEMSYGEKMDIIKANGMNKRGTPLGDFYTQHPEWNSRQDVFAEPEQRMKGFLTDEMWTRYNSLSALDKRRAKSDNPAFGAFVNNPQRDYDALTVEQVAAFVKYVRGYLPESKLTPQIGAIPQAQISDPQQSARYQNMLDEQDRLFNLDAMQPKLDTYQTLSTNDKKAYRAVNKDIDAYFKWYAAQMRANPDLDRLIHPDREPYARTAYPVNTQGATNSVIRQATSNIDYMARKIGDTYPRRFHAKGGGQGGAPSVPLSLKLLSPRAQAALKKKWADPSYFLDKDSYGELYGLYRKYRNGSQSFTQWLMWWQQQGGM